MAVQELRYRNNRLIGRIKEVGGKLEIRDKSNRLKGRYALKRIKLGMPRIVGWAWESFNNPSLKAIINLQIKPATI